MLLIINILKGEQYGLLTSTMRHRKSFLKNKVRRRNKVKGVRGSSYITKVSKE